MFSFEGHLDMVRFLLDAGADQEHKTDEMHTALMEACMVILNTQLRFWGKKRSCLFKSLRINFIFLGKYYDIGRFLYF